MRSTTTLDPNAPRRVLIEYHTSSITPEALLGAMSPAEQAMARNIPTLVESVALLLSALRDGSLVVSAPKKRVRRKQGDALDLVRAALEQEPGASLTQLATMTGLSRSYCVTLRKKVKAV